MLTTFTPSSFSPSDPLMRDLLLSRINDRSARIVIVGLGYVGLPLALEFARAGFRVDGYDVNESAVRALMDGHSHIQDVSDEDLQREIDRGTFRASTDESVMATADAILIAVPTPLVKTRDPDMRYVLASVDAVARHCHPGLLTVLESTTYPGTTRELMQPKLEACGLEIGVDAFLAFSPERVDPGNPKYNIKNTPKVVGGITPACTDLAAALYGAAIDSIVPVSTPEAAELVKLLENTFRSVNIGLVNEMAMVCDRLGVDVWEVIDAAGSKPFGFMKFTPGPGIGGHCIPLDPHYLAWKMRTLNYKTRFIDLASEINSAMPDYVVEKVARALNDVRKPVAGSHVLVLGVAYKKNIDDVRESPALDVIRLLEARGAEVSFHDPYVAQIREEGTEHISVPLTSKTLEAVDAVVIVTDHDNVDYDLVVDHAPLVVDTRNATARTRPGRARVVALSAHV
jgi:UDP-N-acetyl-D-glucosamine dehydrogenase